MKNKLVTCHHCNGLGFTEKWESKIQSLRAILICDFCKGQGKLDWIERIVGSRIGCHDYHAMYSIVRRYFKRFKDRAIVRIFWSGDFNDFLEYGLSNYLKGDYNYKE